MVNRVDLLIGSMKTQVAASLNRSAQGSKDNVMESNE